MLQGSSRCESRNLNSSLKEVEAVLLYEGSGDLYFSNVTLCEDKELDTRDYIKIVWTSASSLPGILTTAAVIGIFGRKVTVL